MTWPPRDGRKLIAMGLLSGGGMAMTVFAWRLATLVAERSPGDPWPLAYGLYGALGLLGLVLISLGWVIGKTAISGKIGVAEFDLGGGESDAAAGAQLATDAAQSVVEELKP